MPTLQQRVHRAERQFQNWEKMGKDLCDDHAEIGQDMGLPQADLDELAQKRQIMEDAIRDYHNTAAQKSVQGGVVPQSGGGPK